MSPTYPNLPGVDYDAVARYDAAQRARLTDRRSTHETYWHGAERRTAN